MNKIKYKNWIKPLNGQKTGRQKVKIKIKCTLVQALRLCRGRTAHMGSRGKALPFLDHGTRRGWGVSVTPQPLFTLGQNTESILQEAGWAPGPVWTRAENLTPTGIRSPDLPARSQSLYRLSYPAYTIKWRERINRSSQESALMWNVKYNVFNP